MTQNNDSKVTLMKTIAILVTLLVAVFTFAFTNLSLSDKIVDLTAVDSELDKRVSLNDERVLRLAQDIAEIKEFQKEILTLLRSDQARK